MNQDREDSHMPAAELRFRPMPYEVDFTGFLSNTVAPRWMEMLRVSMMEACFPHFDTAKPEHLSVIAESQIKYVRPVRYGDAVIGYVHLSSVSFSRWVVDFRFSDADNGNTLIEARQIGAFIHPITHLPVRIPADLRARVPATKTLVAGV